MITGVWKGKLDRQQLELKLVQKGDSLAGTAYYYESAQTWRRYAVRGYFNPVNGQAIWWDDQLIEEQRKGMLSRSPSGGYYTEADFNCPGSDEMYLEGEAVKKETNKEGTVALKKTGNPRFSDEWDYIIENYTAGTNNRELIETIQQEQLAGITPAPAPAPSLPEPIAAPVETVVIRKEVEINKEPTTLPAPVLQDNQTRYQTRQRLVVKEIPLLGDSIELAFYDNAEIDGDSISLFLNGRMLFEHIRLGSQPYILKLALADLETENELTMVAENLGAIPPNTSYMIAWVGGIRYDAQLASSENSSAVIVLKKPGNGAARRSD